MKNLLRFTVSTLLLAASTAAQGNLQMGRMWLTEDPPLAYLEKEYGFKPDQAWLDRLRLASIRFGRGCSSSFVSPKGLIMTNHHCVRGDIARVQGKNDWVKDGFYAKNLDDEVKLTGLTVQQVVEIKDVTDAVNDGVADGDDDASIARARRNNMQKLVKEATAPGLKPEVVTLFQGAKFHLYVYKVWSDIRLVCSPHLQTAHFGGDPDNFTYPRFGIDFAFCRAYEDGKPADTSKHYFKWKMGGAEENELVFVTGNPGRTGRLLTKAQLEFNRDVRQPLILEFLDTGVEVRNAIAEKDPAYEKSSRTERFSLQNSQKAFRGFQDGVLEERLMQQKTAGEADFRARIDANPEAKAKYGDAWDKIAEIMAEQRKLMPEVWFTLQPQRYSSPELDRALQIVAGRLQNPDRALRQDPADDGIAARMLTSCSKWLGKDHALVKALIGDLSPQKAVERLRSSKVGDAAFARELIDGGKEAIEQSQDPAIVAARAILSAMPALREKWNKLETSLAVQGARLGQALFAAYGKMVSPDATLTLRFADGRVKGYPYNGTLAPYRTTFWGLYARSCEFDNHHPFDLPQIWLDRKGKVDMNKSVDFVSTNDIIGGNSGSPVVNKDLEVVGLIFDGNIESLPNNFLFRDDVPRAVSVHVEGIMEALTKVYDAERVVEELIGKKDG